MSEIDEKKVFAENLRRVLDAKGVSQQQLAEAVGVSDASVSFWLSASRYPTPGKVQKIADYLGVRKTQLIDRQHPISKTEIIILKLEGLTPEQLDIIEKVIDNMKPL